MKLNKAYYFRLYPNKDDQVLLKKHFGSVRFIYNTMLRFKKNSSMKSLVKTLLIESLVTL